MGIQAPYAVTRNATAGDIEVSAEKNPTV